MPALPAPHRSSRIVAARPFFRLLGSMKLAMVLMGVLVVASVAGTLIESRFDADVALAYVYDSPWFVTWLLLLCANLFGAIMVRYPWKRRQAGFVITHGAIIVILIGAMIGSIWGVEGNMTLVRGEGMQNYLVVNELYLEARSRTVQEGKYRQINTALHTPTPDRPARLRLNDISVSVIGLASELGMRTIAEERNGGKPAIRVVMEDSEGTRRLDHWLISDDVQRDHVAAGQGIIRFATMTGDVAFEASRERPFRLASMPEADCCETESGGTHTPGCCDDHTHEPEHDHSDSPSWTIFYDDEGRLTYEEAYPEYGTRAGALQAGDTFSPMWSDWTGRIEQVVEQAVAREVMDQLSPEAPRSIGSSGALVRVEKDGQSIEKWVQMGSPTHVHAGDEAVMVTFGYRLHPLDFGLTLDHFEVQFNPGTQTPAGFKSHVWFFDKKTGRRTERQIWMNNPANYPDFPGVGLLGTAYKFSQNSWNPENLDQTTLQVLRDPGWSLKWIGSVLLCVGLFMMFYTKPLPKR